MSLTAPSVQNEDTSLDLTLRPQTWNEYIGQEGIKKNLKILIQAAKERDEAVDHLLFYGPPGLGKTTLANLIAREMGAQIKITSGPAIESRSLDIVIGKGPSARTIQLDLPPFTLIAATTRMALLSSPLRSRFSGGTFRLDFYSDDEIGKIIMRSAKILGISIDKEAILEIAKRSRFTHRVANRLLKRARDFAQVERSGSLPADLAVKALDLMEIDRRGLEATDRMILDAIIKKFSGGPVGLATLAAATSEEKETIEEVYEPYLMQLGFIERTSRGRVATRHAYEHIGKEIPSAGQANLI